MKKLLYLPLSAFILFTSCKKQDTQKADPNYQFSLKRDGVLINLGPSHASIGNTAMGEFIYIHAQSPSSKIGMCHTGIRKNIAPGTYTYNFSSSTNLIPFVYYPDSNTSYYADHGTFHVISNDTIARRIELRFQFELYENATHSDTIQVTEGHIIASY